MRKGLVSGLRHHHCRGPVWIPAEILQGLVTWGKDSSVFENWAFQGFHRNTWRRGAERADRPGHSLAPYGPVQDGGQDSKLLPWLWGLRAKDWSWMDKECQAHSGTLYWQAPLSWDVSFLESSSLHPPSECGPSLIHWCIHSFTFQYTDFYSKGLLYACHVLVLDYACGQYFK